MISLTLRDELENSFPNVLCVIKMRGLFVLHPVSFECFQQRPFVLFTYTKNLLYDFVLMQIK